MDLDSCRIIFILGKEIVHFEWGVSRANVSHAETRGAAALLALSPPKGGFLLLMGSSIRLTHVVARGRERLLKCP